MPLQHTQTRVTRVQSEIINHPQRWTFDTRPLRGPEAFEALRELNRRSPSALTLYYAGGPFRSRVEILQLANGTISRARSTPSFRSQKTAKNIAQSEAQYDTLVLMLSGAAAVTRGDVTRPVRAGEFCLLPGRELHAFTPLPGATCGHLTLVIPGARFGRAGGLDKKACDAIEACAAAPLRQCLTSLASDFTEYSAPEATALLDACASLLTAQCQRHSQNPDLNGAPNGRRGELLQIIERRIVDPSLSAAAAATEMGISERRVHQLFASLGTTFRSHVSERRIRHAAVDLCAAPQGQPIWEIACRWGFVDMATFRKAFRRVFGVTPRDLRRML